MPNFFTSFVGSKPSVPDLPTLNLSQEQQKALAANIQALPQAEQLGANVNLFNQQQVDQMLENVIPNYKAITGTIGQNIAQLSAGQIPTDVAQQVERSDAAQALAGGFSGSAMGGALTARDLGLTSLNLTQQGLQSAESWLQTANSLYAPGQFNVSSMFISPQQQASFDVAQNEAQFQRQWMQNQISAMPAPWASDLKQFVYRAMAAYSGTSVPNDPYSTPGSFGGGLSSPWDPSAGGLNDTSLDGGGGDTFGGAELDAGAGFGGGFGGLA